MMRQFAFIIACGFATYLASTSSSRGADMEHIRISGDKKGFSLVDSNRRFVPWGFNYDHDETGRLIEDYWDKEWDKVVEDFGEMRDLGANVVRIHLQTGKFLRSADAVNEQALAKLKELLALAEKTGLYLDLTGLGCYHKADVPAWYDELDEPARWKAQATFWGAIAGTCAASPAVFCYDLMNEPVVPGGRREANDWLGPPFAGKHFVQFITMSQQDRPRPAIAKAWIHQLAAAIRQHDRQHLITVGLVDWSLDRPGLTSGFVLEKIADEVDFLCVHIYPHAGKIEESLQTLRGFAVGKPVVIEETFPLQAPLDEFEKFIDGSRRDAAGWIGFYWGKTPAECRKSGTVVDAIVAGWLDFFVRKGPEMKRAK